MPCTPCNNGKRAHWPTKSQTGRGVRYANPCTEWDYGTHLVERKDGTLKEVTPCGKYHRDRLLLNRPDLVNWRREKAERQRELRGLKKRFREKTKEGADPETLGDVAFMIARFEKDLERCIPKIHTRPIS